jgi:HEAT repeat protein
MTDDLKALVRRALAFEDYDSDERWESVAEFQRRADRMAFDAAVALAGSDVVAERVLGLDVLGQIGHTENYPFLDETLPVLIEACADDREEVVAAAVSALGSTYDPRSKRGLPAVLAHVAHTSDRVRFSVACALPAVADDPPDEDAVAALIVLSSDSASDIRDWATFGLGVQLDVDSAAIRDALADRLADTEGDTAGEALVGLARRHDARAVPYLLRHLDENAGNLIVEAAAELGAPEALPALLQLKENGWQKDEARPDVLDEAIRACQR